MSGQSALDVCGTSISRDARHANPTGAYFCGVGVAIVLPSRSHPLLLVLVETLRGRLSTLECWRGLSLSIRRRLLRLTIQRNVEGR